MNPLYFGDSSRRLYGVHVPPKGRGERRQGVVLCYPFGQEYMRAHRAFRQLANLLVRRGFHVFRFDYYATGDSDGESDQADVAGWPGDVICAIEELQASADLDAISLVGLRLGAAMAALAACERRDVDQLVLWDPVVSGAAYLEELAADHAGPVDGTIGVLGFPVTPEMRADLARVDLSGALPPEGVRPSIYVSNEDASARGLADAWGRRGREVTLQCIASPGSWNEVDDFGSALVPRDLIQGILEQLCKGGTHGAGAEGEGR